MSFAEIAQLPKKEKDEVIAEMKRSERSSFNDFELQAANQKGEQIDARIQAANQKEKSVDQALNQSLQEKETQVGKMVGQAKEFMDKEGKDFLSRKLQALQSAPESSDIAQRLISQGATREDIASGRYKSTLEAYLIVENAQALTPKDPNKARQFEQSVDNIRLALGLSVPANQSNLDTITTAHVLGPHRANIEAAGREVINNGKYESLAFDEQSRQIVFSRDNGRESLVIDTTSEPPTRSIKRSTLSIEQPLPTPSNAEKERTELRSSLESTHQQYQSRLS